MEYARMFEKKLSGGKIKYGKWYTEPLTGKRKRVYVTLTAKGTRKDAKIAEAKLDEKIADLTKEDSEIDKEELTFGELCDMRLKWMEENLKPQTKCCNEFHLRTLRRLIGEDTLVCKLNKRIVESKLSSDHPKAVTYNERLKYFHSTMKWGYQYDYVEDISFIDRLSKKEDATNREKNAMKFMEKEEIYRVLEHMDIKLWYYMTFFLVLSGLRIGEAMALVYDDLDMRSRILHVNRTYALNIREVSTPKTSTSTREVFMQDQLYDLCKEIIEFSKNKAKRMGYKSNLLFARDDGSYIIYESYAGYLRKVTNRVLHRSLSPHSLRHTHVALMAEAGISLDVISRRLGHSNPKITRDVYLHITKSLQKKDFEAVSSVVLIS